ncbi:mechanosensitive ion channel family protein [Citricoccus sp. NR2]|uniref:mechanosensitive ion channel family protein n=1 Tax=Citricoccus sp. NR2 TaxID=3004095 RepID=UPI0022DD5EF9|nr:mechanosensitive ion channel domain-containing protein [Citricoccus sp. NR2]WBL20355.1 mechanosensitive ion channel [Citricoccus sp. NR2]
MTLVDRLSALPSSGTVSTLLTAATEEPSSSETLGPTVPQGVQSTGEETIEAVGPVLGLVINVLVAVGIALAVVMVIALVARVVLHRRPETFPRMLRLLVPIAAVLSFLAARIAVSISDQTESWVWMVGFAMLIGLAASVAWLAMRILGIVERQVLSKYGSDGIDDRRDRKVQTQMRLIKRILVAVIIVIAISAVLLSIPSVRALGAGILASAGLISVVAGLAVQSTLTNVFAGVQLAFTDAARVGDVVQVDDVFGNIEDITLSYVVVKIWDGRRVIYPSSYFTTTPFENWTRTGSALSGTIEFDLDWQVPMQPLRARLLALLESTDLWDGRDASMQVTDAVGGMVRVRAVVSARNSGDLWDLRCLVREDLVAFIHADYPEALYAVRYNDNDKDKDNDDEDELDEVSPTDGGGVADSATAPSSDPRDESTDARSMPRIPSGTTGEVPGPGEAPATQPQPTVPGAESADTEAPRESTGSVPLTVSSEHSSVFTGSISAIERNRDLAGPGDDVYEDRKRQQAESTGELDVVEPSDEAAEDEHDQSTEDEPRRTEG